MNSNDTTETWYAVRTDDGVLRVVRVGGSHYRDLMRDHHTQGLRLTRAEAERVVARMGTPGWGGL